MYLHRKRCTTLHSVRVCQSLRPKCTLVSWNQLEMQVRNCKMLSAASPLGCRLWFRRLHNLIDSDSDIFCKFDTTENSFDIPLVETEYMIDLCLHYALLIAFLIARHFEKLLICLTLLFFFCVFSQGTTNREGPCESCVSIGGQADSRHRRPQWCQTRDWQMCINQDISYRDLSKNITPILRFILLPDDMVSNRIDV